MTQKPENTDPEDISATDEQVSSHDENVSSHDENVSSPDENSSSPDEEVSSHDENVSSHDEEVSSPDENVSSPDENASEPTESVARSTSELMAVVEALIFVADEPLTPKMMADVLGEEKDAVLAAVEELAKEYEERSSGLQIRGIAGGWQIATRTEYHEEVRTFLKTKPSAKLSLAALETLAVIAYKQPVTVPEILEIRGVQSASAIKTLLEKRLIITKGHKETVGRPMMYGTSKEFLLHFGLKDLSELPSIEDFQDLVQ
ncbi:MAG: SMC-Scp complex subunit ScpB [Pyrinomonadaceae bacterium]|nr:SMC-Scp complex subunit ScpB [Pyrinomonadaceae bacterium]